MNPPLVIFDFNRTLFDPDTGRLLPSAREVLETLGKNGVILGLISYGDDNRRQFITDLDLDKFFSTIIITNQKTAENFQTIIDRCPQPPSKTFIVGDRVKREITIGNSLNCITIWFRQDKFANELPDAPTEQPTYTITDLPEVLAIVLHHHR